MEERQKQKLFTAPIVILLIFASLFICGGIYYLFFYNMDAVKRQDTEMELADDYVSDLLEWTQDKEDLTWEEWQRKYRADKKDSANETESESDSEEESEAELETEAESAAGKEDEQTKEVWSDDNWYSRDGVTYTPDYAQGYVQCVLEIPSVKIRRGVYSGTWDEIRYNLNIWMVTASRPDYELGKTHFCIYGHNHTQQDLSFNRLKDVKTGDLFSLTSDQGYYEYEVTGVFAVTREKATSDFVDNFCWPREKCYIITCGRGEHRYLDLIVEGTLKRELTIEEYAKELLK